MNSSKQQNFDVILVVEYFRSIPYYLSVIKYLSDEFRIGLHVVPMDDSFWKKNGSTQQKFVETCLFLGAEMIDTARVVETDLLIIPQRKYNEEAIQRISEFKAKKKVGALALARVGFRENDRFLEMFDLDKAFVMDLRFHNHLLSCRGDRSVYENREMVEVGVPFMRYPVFKDVSVDYMIAMPTSFSFAHETDKWLFMETVLKLLDQIPTDERIAIKTHNGMDRDQFSRPWHRWLASMLSFLPSFGNLIRKVSFLLKGKIGGKYIGQVYTSFLYEKVLKRAVPFSCFTEFNQFAMEIFLPGVQKGVIGGLSNTTWGALHARVPYYNCVDISAQDRTAPDRLYGKKDASQTIEINLEYFGVPYCDGNLEFAAENFDILAESTREGDLLGQIRLMLGRAKKQSA